MMDKKRCSWVGSEDIYIKYHDEEWGNPLRQDHELFEMITLEGAQAGLSWLTVLKRREGYREAFQGFDLDKVSSFKEKDVQRILKNPGVIRHEGKIRSTIQNAQAIRNFYQSEGRSFSDLLWSFVEGKPLVNSWKSTQEIPTETPESKNMSKTLKKIGFSFVGSTICYAFMQACGMVWDHTEDCFRHEERD